MSIIRAAGIRALRTLLQGLLAGGVINGIVALLAEGGDPQVLLVSALTVVGAAVASFIQGVLAGLPEAEPVESTLDALIGLANAQGVSLSDVSTDEDAVAALIAHKPKAVRKS